MTADCLFCKIVRGEIPSKLVAETESCVAFRDINPVSPVHVLVIPRKHIASLDGAHDPELVGQIVLLAVKIARDEGASAGGYRVVMNTGRDGGQSVDHLHLHLLAGRRMGWPPG